MKDIVFSAVVVLLPTALTAQKVIKPMACVLDTAAHRDTLALEFSLQAFRNNDVRPDPILTRAFGDIIRAHLTVPPSFGQLLYPNTYFPAASPHGYTRRFGTLQFELLPTGNVENVKWYAASFDPATDAALEAAFNAAITTNEQRDVAAILALKKKQLVRLLFLATQDTALHAPLARFRTPMLRIDSGGMMVVHAQYLLIPRDMIALETGPPSQFDFIVDETGHVDRHLIQIVWTENATAFRRAIAPLVGNDWIPFRAGGCPVAGMLRHGAEK